ncbi:MAG TPA: DUF58 domain-containing protein [Acidimicrobiales bacterium]|nr:DUF58 domain-containing protein [Acidimicrobiales bacterium]
MSRVASARPREPLAGEWKVAMLGLALALVGWWTHAILIAMGGAVVAVTAAALRIWQRESLTGVSYRRHLDHDRASFGERVTLELQFVNDKLLPLTWLHVDDEVPAGLTITGATVLADVSDRPGHLHHVVPMLPYQRVRRRLTVVCDQRGWHRFGPAELVSGNPAAYQENRRPAGVIDRLLVYPKVFRLDPTGIASRVPIGDLRATQRLFGDPTRILGVRRYEPGDPLRHIDWRASARSDELLVRVFEPTTALRVAVFVDVALPQVRRGLRSPDELEFLLAVAASWISALAEQGVAVGLYSPAMVDGQQIAAVPTSSPGALADLLELLARATAWGSWAFGPTLVDEAGRLPSGTSVLVIAPHFPEATLVAVQEVRRRLPVSAVWVDCGRGGEPPADLVERSWHVTYGEDWKQRETLDLAG